MSNTRLPVLWCMRSDRLGDSLSGRVLCSAWGPPDRVGGWAPTALAWPAQHVEGHYSSSLLIVCAPAMATSSCDVVGACACPCHCDVVSRLHDQHLATHACMGQGHAVPVVSKLHDQHLAINAYVGQGHVAPVLLASTARKQDCTP